MDTADVATIAAQTAHSPAATTSSRRPHPLQEVSSASSTSSTLASRLGRQPGETPGIRPTGKLARCKAREPDRHSKYGSLWCRYG